MLQCVLNLVLLHQAKTGLSCKYAYSKTCVRGPLLRLTLNSGRYGKSCLSYKGTCHVILLAKLHDMYLYKTATFPHQPLRSISKVAVLHRFYCMLQCVLNLLLLHQAKTSLSCKYSSPYFFCSLFPLGSSTHCFSDALAAIFLPR